jgi:GR25 family glycosyltransferase involved in LPS biosynthesis
MKQPDCFVIARNTSRVVADCTSSLRLHGWSFTVASAVDGWQLTQQDWDNTGIKMSDQGKMPYKPGAQGCWHSHFKLWKQCVDTDSPMVILEHDAVVKGPWPEELNIEPSIIKLYTTAHCKQNPITGAWSKGSHAYTLTPDQAKKLIDHAKTVGAVAVDKQIGSKACSWNFYQKDLVQLNPNRGRSTTSPIRL